MSNDMVCSHWLTGSLHCPAPGLRIAATLCCLGGSVPLSWRGMKTDPSKRGMCVQRIIEPPPEGYKVQWEVELDAPDEVTDAWGVYAAPWQDLMEVLWVQGAAAMDYQPGTRHTYKIDFNKMMQVRTSCKPGWGASRTVRRVFVRSDAARQIKHWDSQYFDPWQNGEIAESSSHAECCD